MKTSLLVVLLIAVAHCEFDLQYIGDSLTEEEAVRPFCNTKYCIGDSQILFYAATQNSSVDPCLDFKEFSMGTLIKYRALNERYFAIGLQQDVAKLHDERQRKLLAAPVNDKDPRVFKVMKNFFTKCVSSKNVIKKGKQEIIDHLKSLGGSPYLNGASWDPSNFNISKIIEQEPYFGTLFLLDFEFKTWSNPDGYNKTNAIPSLIKEGIYFVDENERATFSHYTTMLNEMNEVYKLNSNDREAHENEIGEAQKRFETFTKELRKHEGKSGLKIIKMKELQKLTPNLNIDWTKVVNDQLQTYLRVTEEDEILIHSPASLTSLAAALDDMDKGAIADAFVMKFLYAHRFLFIVYPFDWQDASYTSNSKALQRWETCLKFLTEQMRPAVEVLQSRSGERDAKALGEFVKGTVDDFIELTRNVNESIFKPEIRDKLIEKLNLIDILAESFAHDFTDDRLEDYYTDLKLNGKEDLVKSALEIKQFQRKIANDYKDLFEKDSRSSLDSASKGDLISYNTIDNTLRVPSKYTYYPWFHPERPKFFNQVTLYLDIFTAVKDQAVRYAGNVLFADAYPYHSAINVFDFAYDNYVRWEENGGKDLILGANRLTTRQLFWLALARSRYRKQKPVPGTEGNDYDRTFFWFKNMYEPLETYDRFKEAYKCKSVKA